MAQELTVNYEYIGNNIGTFIQDRTFLDTYDIKQVDKILKYATLSTEQYVSILKEGSLMYDSHKLILCVRNAHVTLQNMHDAIKVLKYSKKYLKIRILKDLFNVLSPMGDKINEYEAILTDLKISYQNLQSELENTKKNSSKNQITR